MTALDAHRRLRKGRRFHPLTDLHDVASTLFHAASLAILVLLIVALRVLVLPNPDIAALSRPPLAPHRSFVAISVDDFGRFSDSVPLQPNEQFINNNPDLQLQTSPSFRPWYTRATVETSNDLRQLSKAITKLNTNVTFEQKVVLTPHWVVGGPDFEAMRAAGCRPSFASASVSSPITVDSSSAATSTSNYSPSNLNQRSVKSHDDLNPSSSTISGGRNNGLKHSNHAATEDGDVSSTSSVSNSVPLSLASVVESSSAPNESRSACAYRERLLSDRAPTGAEQAPYNRGDLRKDYLSLWHDGIWHPEYHGRSHFNVDNWLRLLGTDSRAQKCFDNNMVCASDPSMLRSEFTGFKSSQALKSWLKGGVDAFSAFFGYRPVVMSSPHNAWHSLLIDAAKSLGFVGAELAEDQEAYLSKFPDFGLHDRYRFDVFFPGFNCDRAISEVTNLLRVPGPKTWSDVWYDFLSAIDIFRVHYRPYHHSPGGNHERFMSLMWHAQNIMTSTYSDMEHGQHMQCMERAVQTIRQTLPRTVFVTGSELHQIRQRGWSLETWSDSVVLRNYGTSAVAVQVPDLRDLQRSAPTWRNGRVAVSDLRGHEDADGQGMTAGHAVSRVYVLVGDLLTLQPDAVVRLSVEEIGKAII